jgi:hypothetical protein
MNDYLSQFPGASDIKRKFNIAADELANMYEQKSSPDWRWFENILAYDNAVLPQALFLAGQTFNDDRYTQIAKESCDFLLEQIFNGEYFSFIGCNGWYRQGEQKAQFDQQPINTASTIMMFRTAYDVTEERKYLIFQRKAFDWFIGENDIHVPLYDFRTKGCCDGLMAGGVNENQGAESTLCFLLSLMAIIESYTTAEKLEINPTTDSKKVNHITDKTIPINPLQMRNVIKKNSVEEMT